MVNISLATPASTVVNEAVRALVDADIFVAVAAGNHKRDASQISPASEEAVCTVAAIDENDEPAAFSNFGPLVDLYAPGVDILSAARGIGEETHNTVCQMVSMICKGSGGGGVNSGDRNWPTARRWRLPTWLAWRPTSSGCKTRR